MRRRPGGRHGDVYPTPDWLWQPLHQLLRFELDAAADAENAKCRRYYDERANGLAQPWDARSVWCNPPYGRRDTPTSLWAWHGRRECERLGNRVTLLVPVKAETKWYQHAVWGDNRVVQSGRLEAGRIRGRWYRLQEPRWFVEVLELEGRVSFAAGANGWFASAIVVFNAGPRPLLPRLESLARRSIK